MEGKSEEQQGKREEWRHTTLGRERKQKDGGEESEEKQGTRKFTKRERQRGGGRDKEKKDGWEERGTETKERSEEKEEWENWRKVRYGERR